MEKLPESPADERPHRVEVEFSLLHYRRRGLPAASAPPAAGPIWHAVRWIAGLLIGALLGRWLTGSFP
ncbi:MAG TPA: hypothetical protein VEX86_17730 [Longimicrobium sp.]|nr:hypothetical protein [Longimicrobium sp.]